MAEPVRARRLTDQEGQRLQQIVRRGRHEPVRVRRAMIIMASASGTLVPAIGVYKQIGLDLGFVAVVYPAALREILGRILHREKYRDVDEPNDWQAQWLRFAAQVLAIGEPPAVLTVTAWLVASRYGRLCSIHPISRSALGGLSGLRFASFSVRADSIVSVRNCTCAWANSQQAHKANPRGTNFKSVINVSPAVDAFR